MKLGWGKGRVLRADICISTWLTRGSVLRNQVQSLICKTDLYRKRMGFAHAGTPSFYHLILFIMAMNRDNVNAVGVGKTLPSTFRYLWFELSVKL